MINPFICLISAIILGLFMTLVIELMYKYYWNSNFNSATISANPTNTISKEHIRECICFKSDNSKAIDQVFQNLQNENIDVEFSVEF